jgi:hypothetical protein
MAISIELYLEVMKLSLMVVAIFVLMKLLFCHWWFAQVLIFASVDCIMPKD